MIRDPDNLDMAAFVALLFVALLALPILFGGPPTP